MLELLFLSQNTITKNSLNTLKKNTNVFQRLWASIDWDKIIANIIVTVITILFLSLLFLLLNKIGKRIIDHVFQRYLNKGKYSANRMGTIRSLINNLYTYLLLFFYLYAVLSTLGVPVGTLLAGAGILSLAIGLGAQGFVNDLVTGLFILIEEQFNVGDVVTIGTITGTITAMGLRTTQIRSADGTLNFIPNRNITIVSNQSRGNRQVMINLRIYSDTDINQLETILKQVNIKLLPQYGKQITSGPDLLGVNDLGHGELAYQIQLSTINGEQIPIQRTFLKAYLQALQAKGFELPQSPLNLNKS